MMALTSTDTGEKASIDSDLKHIICINHLK